MHGKQATWNNVLGGRDIGISNTLGECVTPGFAEMQQGGGQLDASSSGEREQVLVFLPAILRLLCSFIFRKRLVTTSFAQGILSYPRRFSSLL